MIIQRIHPRTVGPSDLALFNKKRPVKPEFADMIAYHGYPWLIHRLTYRRTNHKNFHVRE